MRRTIIYSFTEDFIPCLLNALGCMTVGVGGNGTFSVSVKYWGRFNEEEENNVQNITKIYHRDFPSHYVHDEHGHVYLDIFKMARSLVPSLTFENYQNVMAGLYNKPRCDNLIKLR